MLYKFFKLYFVEQEKKWINVVYKTKEKIKYYKDLCRMIFQAREKNLNILEKLNDILVSNKMTEENLNNHKTIIKALLTVINQKREEMFIMNSKVEIAEKELNFWIYDFEKIKANRKLREEISKINVDKLLNNLKEEVKHKK